MSSEQVVRIGPYAGRFSEAFRDPAFVGSFEEQFLAGSSMTSTDGKDVDLLELCHGEKTLKIAIKRFARRVWYRDRHAARHGSAAERSWRSAERLVAAGVGTARPVGYLENWEDGRLRGSMLLTEFVDFPSFRDELIELYRRDPDCSKFMALINCIARAVRGMHDAGIVHYDLGNQNILVRRVSDGEWADVSFIDLNRARESDRPSIRQCARDISRIALPSDLLRVFVDMYFQCTPPDEFLEWESRYRSWFAWHTKTRRWRHPLRERLVRDRETYPPVQDMWIWDERSAQAVNALTTSDRNKIYPFKNHLRQVAAVARRGPVLWRAYRDLQAECFRAPVEMKHRVGVALNPRPGIIEAEVDVLKGLGNPPVRLRFYAHESEASWDFSADWVGRLAGDGISVSVALVQDRAAVREPDRWQRFCHHVLERVAPHVQSVEIGHAINRVKWGVWNFDEYAEMMRRVAKALEPYPDLPVMGPSVIDFEYPFLVTALDAMPEELHLSALSHLLYVDRRGAPENKQGPFDAVGKFALARAIARCSSGCDDRLVVTETNWPLQGAGVYSPVGSPYVSPRPRKNDLSVDENRYADFMLRYILLALCSGMVAQVYWWRLVARGYGLVDDSDAAQWRLRPAYQALRFFLETLGDATFERRLPSESGIYMFGFRLADQGVVTVAYSAVGERTIDLPIEVVRGVTSLGEPVAASGCRATLNARPVYLYGV